MIVDALLRPATHYSGRLFFARPSFAQDGHLVRNFLISTQDVTDITFHGALRHIPGSLSVPSSL